MLPPPPDLSQLSEAERDALIVALWTQVQALTARRGVGSAAEGAAEDPGQLWLATIQGAESQPPCRPRALAAARPAFVRSRMRSRSISASAAIM
jgi:hypothetical protein